MIDKKEIFCKVPWCQSIVQEHDTTCPKCQKLHEAMSFPALNTKEQQDILKANFDLSSVPSEYIKWSSTSNIDANKEVAIDASMNIIYNLLKSKSYEIIDLLFASLNVQSLRTDVGLSILTVTCSQKDEFKNRTEYLAKLHNKLMTEIGKNDADFVMERLK